MTEWLADNIIAVIMILVGVLGSWYKLGGRMDNIEAGIKERREALDKTMESHHQAFRDVRDKHDKRLGLIETHGSPAIRQRLETLEKHHDERFDRIERHYEQIQATLNQLIRMNGGNG